MLNKTTIYSTTLTTVLAINLNTGWTKTIGQLELTTSDQKILQQPSSNKSTVQRYVPSLIIVAMSSKNTTEDKQKDIVVGDKLLVQKNDNWYVKSDSRLFPVNLKVLSLKFVSKTTLEQEQKFMRENNLTVVRKNRLGIYDVNVPADKNTIEVFRTLHGHALLEFVELNVTGEYE